MDGTIITKRGMQLLVKLMATKGVLNFTRVSVGTGSIPSGYDPASMIELVQYKMDGMISKCSAEEDVARITMQISSAGIETGFIMTEMGVFAADPDIGEILYAYLDMKDDPQYIYAEGGETQKFVETTLEVTIESSTKVSTYINPSSLITKEEFDKEVEKIINPEFDDAGETEEIKSFPDFIAKVKSKMNIFDFFRNFKAGLKFVLHTGQIVNNCVSDNAELPLSAAQGKVLMDLLNQTNSNFILGDDAKSMRFTVYRPTEFPDRQIAFLASSTNDTQYLLYTANNGPKMMKKEPGSTVWEMIWEGATKSDLPQIGDFRINTVANDYVVVSSNNIISGTLPNNYKLCTYAIVGHSTSRSSIDIISCDSNDLVVYSDTAQTLTIRWFLFKVI